MGNSVDSISSQTGTSGGTAGKLASVTNSGTTKDQFLQLLVAELKHQDPLDPQKGAEFVAQLAQFSSLEASADTNSKLAEIATNQVQAQRASYAGFIGKTVSSRTDSVQLDANGAVSGLSAHFDGAVNGGKVTIKNAAGQVVRVLDLPPGAKGDVPVVWDGKDDKGKALPAGSYGLEVSGIPVGGGQLSGFMQITGVVSGLEFGAEGPRFRVGNTSVDPSTITAIN